MSAEKNQELQDYLTELSEIVNLYNPRKEYFNFKAVIVAAIVIIFLIIISTIGLIWGFILCSLALLPLCYVELPSRMSNPTEKELSKRACIIMNKCVNLYKYPDDDPISIASRMILHYEMDGNLALYEEFISLFPSMASNKLKKLSTVKIR